MTAYSLLTTAERAVEAGISVVPPRTDGTKAPLGSWRMFQARLPYAQELDNWYRAEQNPGIGVVCGAVSGNLEAVDFDRHSVYDEFIERARETGLAELVDRIEAGYLERTPKGRHWLWRCSEIAGNTKLASNEIQEVLIETRGEGGYVIVAPSSGSIHPSGEPYELLQGSIDTITAITPEERELLLDLARSFDHVSRRADLPGSEDQSRPGDHYNAATTWSELLLPAGWRQMGARDGITSWQRPGKTIGISATTNFAGADLLHVFTSSTGFEPEIGRAHV